MLKLLLPFFVFIAWVQLSAQSPEPGKIFEEANNVFQKANKTALLDPDQARELYQEAARKYQYLVNSKHRSSVPILMNLGNAYYFSGDNGRALLNYHRGLILAPADEDLRHNLNFVRSQCIDEFSEGKLRMILNKIFFWHQLALHTRIILFGILYFSCWFALIVLLFRKSRLLRNWAIGTAVVSLLLAISVIISSCNIFQPVDGVITSKEAQAFQGDGYIYNAAFTTPLHSGSEFDLIEKRGNWYYIQLMDNSKCWIPAKDAELINF